MGQAFLKLVVEHNSEAEIDLTFFADGYTPTVLDGWGPLLIETPTDFKNCCIIRVSWIMGILIPTELG